MRDLAAAGATQAPNIRPVASRRTEKARKIECMETR